MPVRLDPRSPRYRFCWYPSQQGSSIRIALIQEIQLTNLDSGMRDVIVGSTLAALQILSRGDLWDTGVVKDIRSPGLPVFEIRLDFGLKPEIGQLRIYCHLMDDLALIIGLVVRFKNLLGTREKIREQQNLHIVEARRILSLAQSEDFEKCLERSSPSG